MSMCEETGHQPLIVARRIWARGARSSPRRGGRRGSTGDEGHAGTEKPNRRLLSMRDPAPSQRIDPLTAADSVIALLGDLNTDKFSPDERIAVANVQVEAAEEWLAAYLEAEAMTAAYALVRMYDSSAEHASGA